MARTRKSDRPPTDTPFVVRDVPEDTRRRVRVYAAEHDLTMGQAIEAIVDRISRRHDAQLLDMLFELYQQVEAHKLEDAQHTAALIHSRLATQNSREFPEED